METVYWEGEKLRNTHLFSTAAQIKMKTGNYCQHPKGSKAYFDFWKEEFRRCREGYEINGVHITGYNYFWLNYHQMDIVLNANAPTSRKIRGFPRFALMQYHFFKLVEYAEKVGKHICLLKPRGTGYSEIASAMGARDYTFSDKYENSVKHHKIFYFASELPFLNKDGVVSKAFENVNYLYSNTQGAMKHLRHEKDQDTAMHYKASMKKTDGTIEQTGGEIIGRVVDNVDKVRGARGYKLFFEEAGAFKNLEKAVEVARALVEEGGVITGTMVVWGTANEGNEIEGFRKIFSNPSAYNFVKFKNVWGDDNTDINTVPLNPLDYIEEDDDAPGCGMFLPRWAFMNRFLDEDGNPKKQEAYEYIVKERKKKESDPGAYHLFVGDNPIYPEEALRRKTGSPFNVAKLSKQLSDIRNKHTDNPVEKGYLHWVYKKGTNEVTGVEWEKNPKGNISITEHPQKNIDGRPYINLYVGGIDSIDKGTSESASTAGSQFCILIKKRTLGTGGNQYVCKYNERPLDVRDAYENSLKILTYYDCLANLEDSKISIIAYYREKKLLRRLIQRPRIARPDKATMKHSYLIGTPASEKIINHYVNLIKEYVNDFCHNIYYVDMLEQLRDYDVNNRTPYDIIAAMGMCEIYDEEIATIAPKLPNQQSEWKDIGWFTNSKGYKEFGVIENKQFKFNENGGLYS